MTDHEILLDSFKDYNDQRMTELDNRVPGSEPVPVNDRSAKLAQLRRLFETLSHVEHFALTFPSAESFHRSYDGIQASEAKCYDMKDVDSILVTVQAGLRSPALQSLVDLRLSVPCTRDIGVLVNGMSSKARNQLRHLSLQIKDATGPSGDEDYSRTEEDNDDGLLEDAFESGFCPSNVQVAYPNRKHQDEIWNFVGSCSNLESLSLEFTHYLDLGRLRWLKSETSPGLRVLRLSRMYTNVASVVELLSPHPQVGRQSVLRRLFLSDLKAQTEGGNWITLVRHLGDNCPDLEFCTLTQLTYFTNHPRFQRNNRIWENVRSVWTEDKEEEKAIEDLLETLTEKTADRDLSGRRMST
jgi:hypothetical protein